MNRFKPYAKAIIAGLITFTGAVATGYAEEPMTTAEWWLAASFGLASLGAVFGIPNKPPTP